MRNAQEIKIKLIKLGIKQADLVPILRSSGILATKSSVSTAINRPCEPAQVALNRAIWDVLERMEQRQ